MSDLVTLRMIWIFLLLVNSVFSGPPEEVVKYLNGIYKNTVSGSSTDLLSLEMTLLSERELSKGYVYQMVLLLNNTLTLALDLHYIRFWRDFNETKLQLLQHQVPTRNPAEAIDDQLITNELLADKVLKASKFDLQSLNQSYKEEQQVLSFAGSQYTFSLVNKNVKVKRQEMTAYLVIDSADMKYLITKMTAAVEQNAPKVTQSTGSAALSVFLAASVSFLISVMLTYFLVVVYYKRYQTLPCVKLDDASLVYDLK